MRKKKVTYCCLLLWASFFTTVTAQNTNTPMMGWSSWNTFRVHINEKLIQETADAMVTRGLKDAGYKYVNIDDGYFGGRDSNGYLFTNKKKFPNGMKALADYIHSKGLKAGIYSDAGSNTCGSIYDADTLGVGVGLWQHDDIDCKTFFQDWGYDFIKIDWCGGEATGQSEQQRYTDIYKAINRTGRTDVRYNICRWQFPGTWATRLASSWRIHTDINPRFKTIDQIIEKNLYLSPYVSLGHYNDMDMLEVGRGLSEDEEKTHFGIWAIMSSPLMIGCDLRTIPEKTLSIITNQEVIALNQDSLGMQAEVIERGKDYLILSKTIQKREGKLRAVALYNRSNVIKKIRVDFDKLYLSGKVQVRDLWNHQETGTFTEYYETLVPAHGTALIRLEGSKRHDQICYEAEYAFMQEYLPDNKQMAHFAYKAGASGDYIMKRLGNSPSNWAEFRKVYVSKGGEYQLKITYFSGDKRDIQIAVNESEYKQSGLCSGAWDQAAITTVKVKLHKGYNTIRLYNSNGWAPDIDKMEISKSR
ncbi:alpha-galactosidase [Bacteroides fragilis]|uniref:alpha-galactosidase D n=1 Tax=Bacteroides fragilis TaxID=817 RepID=UPI001F20EB04|nr:alpha-galactosidase [Bacteroides fragilis]MCE8617114.1 alpha-galactosidase [Bacteroides fragilis]MCZ2601651.1 alpha-galactosidase [Bacteroides fragilis]UHZ88021.1 alpha-galactosidase [Bacteroides fragilis]